MAVENKYVNANTAADKLGTPALVKCGDLFCLVSTFEVAAADDDGSIYRLARDLDPELIPVRILINNDAITAGTDYDLGLYEALRDGIGGTVVDKDVFVDGADMSSARARGSELDGLTAVDFADSAKRLFEHGGQTQITKKAGYDLAFTANTVGSAAGTIALVAFFAQG